jgi:CheY-like chemotaxis protein
MTKPVKVSQLYDCLATVMGVASGGSDRSEEQIITRHTLMEDKKRRVRILVAEDNVVNQKVAVRILEKLGYRADAVANGHEALAALEKIRYDLVLMDVQMPEMNGFEATRIIRDPGSRVPRHDIPIVAMTAHALKGDRERCLEAGMDDYVSKPVTALGLGEILERHLKIVLSSGEPVSGNEPFQAKLVEIEQIREVAEGDTEFERDLIETFLSDTQDQIDFLEAALRDGNAEEVRARAHTIKGSSANAGAKGLQEIAHEMERIGAGRKLEDAAAVFSLLNAAFEQAREYLQAYLKTLDPSAGEPPELGPQDPVSG